VASVLGSEENRRRIRDEVSKGIASAFYYVPRDDESEAYGKGPLADVHWPHYVRITRSNVPDVVGKTIWEISAGSGKDPFDTLCDLLVKDPATCKRIARESASDKDSIVVHPLFGFGSDGGLVDVIRRPGIANPTLYSIFPYIFKRHVRELGMLRLEEAVRKASRLPLAAHGVEDRGLLRPGYWADIVIFDPDTIGPRVTFDEKMPKPPCTGIHLVAVNGEVTVRDGMHTGGRAGRVLRFKPEAR
jgi:N-acyl-D-aspartate/D-glutamate deacylase